MASNTTAAFLPGADLLFNRGHGLKKLLATPAPPESSAIDKTAVQQAADEAARRRSRSRGARSTILSQSFLSPDSPALQQTFGS